MAPLPQPHVLGVEHRYVTVRGVRLHYAEAGAGEPLVLQHGWPQHWYSWRELIGPLAERYRVICPDLRGFGWSDAPRGGYEKPQLTQDLIGLLDALGLDRVRLVGHDWGGFIGFLACLGHPERISHFMPLSIPHLWPPEGPPDPRRLAQAWYQVVIASPGVGPLAVGRLGFGRRILEQARTIGRFTESELDLYEEALQRPASLHASTQLYRTFLLHELRPFVQGHFRTKRLHTPTRLLIGERDPIGKGVDRTFERYADDMTLEWVPGAGHFLPEETPELVLERALAFFASA